MHCPVVIHRIRTDHGSAFATDFTWNPHDLGSTHRPIPRSPLDLARKLRGRKDEYNHRRPHLAISPLSLKPVRSGYLSGREGG